MTVEIVSPVNAEFVAQHHRAAATRNKAATDAAIAELLAVFDENSATQRILLKAAAGAGKSHALKRMVEEVLLHPRCERVGIVAFANKQIFPLARDLGVRLGHDSVCLRISPRVAGDLDAATIDAATVATANKEIPDDVGVLVMTSHMGGHPAYDILKNIGPAANGERLFDVLFVDEAWQLPIHLYRNVERHAPVVVGVGDVGQLPPLDRANNPYRGDGQYNPYRAWPNTFDDDATWSAELPAVWRPNALQLPLWRAFYSDWDGLDCVAGPGDRSFTFNGLRSPASDVWASVADGTPTLVEIDGLIPPDAPDVDPPLLAVVESWLDELIEADPDFRLTNYDDRGSPKGEETFTIRDATETAIAVLATRNQAVEDAEEIVERLEDRHQLPKGAIVASTVDSWQGQTNALTVAVHPLSGASELDEFNSSFGRLAVTCTRATHGLLLVARHGLDEMLADAPARPGTPFGEPGPRALPRQTHQRILAAFARGTVSIDG